MKDLTFDWSSVISSRDTGLTPAEDAFVPLGSLSVVQVKYPPNLLLSFLTGLVGSKDTAPTTAPVSAN